MRILVDGSSIDPQQKGVGNYAYHLVAQLAERTGHSIHVLVHSEAAACQLSGLGVTTHVRSPCAEVVKGLWQVPAEIRRLDINLLVSANECIAFFHRVPRIAVCHDIDELIVRAQQPTRLYRRALNRLWSSLRVVGLRRCRAVICNSRFVQQQVVAAYQVDQARTALAYCGVDPVFSDVATEPATEDGGYLLLFATGDSRENPQLIPELIAALRRLGVDTPVRVGTGPDSRWLEDAIGEADVRDVSFFDFVPWRERSRLARIYRDAAIYVELSAHEGFGMQLAEAMATGTVCVSSGRGALTEVGGPYAINLGSLDPEQIAVTIRNTLSARDSTRGAPAQVEWTRRYSWKLMGKVLTDALEGA